MRGKDTPWTGCQSNTRSLSPRCIQALRFSRSGLWKESGENPSASCCPFELALNDLCRPVWPLRVAGDRDRNTLSPFLMCKQAVLKANLFRPNQTHLLPVGTARSHSTRQTTAPSRPIRGARRPTRAVYLQQTRASQSPGMT